MNKFLFFTLSMLFFSLGEGVKAQSLSLDDQNGFKNCSVKAPFEVKLINSSIRADYQEGTFGVIWGGGKAPDVTNLDYDQVTGLTNTYGVDSSFILKFYGIRVGQTVADTIEIEVINEPKNPAVGILTPQGDDICINDSVRFTIPGYELNSFKVKYVADFGDGTTETFTSEDILKNSGFFPHIYRNSHCEMGKPNGFTLRIKATNGCDRQASTTKENIYVYRPPEAEFVFINSQGDPTSSYTTCVGKEVKIRNITEPEKGEMCGAETDENQYTWIIENGKRGGVGDTILKNVSSRNLSWVFDIAGVHNITLIAENKRCPGADSTTLPVSIGDSVIANFHFSSNVVNDSVCAGEVTLINQSQAANTYFWEINSLAVGGNNPGDFNISPGFSETSGSPKVTFEKGVYVIKLTAYNDCSENSKYDTLYVKENSIVLQLSQLSSLCPGETLVIRPQDVDYRWAWPDFPETPEWEVFGGTENTDWEWVSGYGKNHQTPRIKFLTHGNYDVKVTVFGVGCGMASSQQQPITIHDPAINTGMTANKTTVCENEKLIITNTFAGVNLKTPVWKVKRGNKTATGVTRKTTGNETEFTFSRYGEYTIQAILTAECGKDTSQIISVTVRRPPSVKLDDLSKLSFCPADQLNMAGYVAYRDYNNPPYNVQWSVTPNTGVSYTASDWYPVMNFAGPTTYKIDVTIDNPAGCSADSLSASTSFTVIDSTLHLDWRLNNNPVCTDVWYDIHNYSIIGAPAKYSWTVEGASPADYEFSSNSQYNASSPTPKVRFKKYGQFTLKVVVQGACHTRSFEIPVEVKKNPVVTLKELGTVCPGPLNIGNSVAYTWNGNTEAVTWSISTSVSGGYQYINGTDLNSKKPELEFIKPGNYKIRATLSDVGCADHGLTVERNLTVLDSTMQLNWKLSADPLCTGVWYQLEDHSLIGEPAQYLWTVIGAVNPGDYEFDPALNQTTATPKIRFKQYGTYTLKVEATSACTNKEFFINVLIKEDPAVFLDPIPDMCPGELDLSNLVRYDWGANSQQVQWILTAPGGAIYQYIGSNENSLYPNIEFQTHGNYTLQAVLTGNGCAGPNLTASRSFSVSDSTISVNVVPERLELGEDSTLRFINTTTGEGINYVWSIDKPSGYLPFNTAHAQPEIVFKDRGKYTVSLKINAICSERDPIDFEVLVRGIPKFTFLKNNDNICVDEDTIINISHYMVCDSAGSDSIRCKWHITPSTGFNFMEGTSDISMFPKLSFTHSGSYTMVLESEAEFGGVRHTTPLKINVLSPNITAAANLSESAGCIDDGFLVNFINVSTGDSLEFKWDIPESGWNGDLTQESPSIDFTEQKEFTVSLEAFNRCAADTAEYKIRAYSKPVVETLKDLLTEDICETEFLFKGDEYVGEIKENGDSIYHIKWHITPAGYVWENGTDQNSQRPDISFAGGTSYTVKGNFKNGCKDTVSVVFTVSVDEFVPVATMGDTVLCTLPDPLLLTAYPAGGSWTSFTGNVLQEKNGETYLFDPGKTTSEVYQIEYSRTNLSCVAKDTLTVTIHQLTVLQPGQALELCVNHESVDLSASINPRGGKWSGAGVQEDTLFHPGVSGVGEFNVIYNYEDPVTLCLSRDTLSVTVHGLPDPGFTTTKERYCQGEITKFIPDALGKGNKYIWNFGDGKPVQEEGDAHMSYEYELSGTYDVWTIAESLKGCLDTLQNPVKVPIEARPPKANFLVDRSAGCGPLDVDISITASMFTDTTLRFAWNYGNGNTSEAMEPVDQTYLGGIEDTTYILEFVITNRCGVEKENIVINAYSSPKADFAIVNAYECSPVVVPLANRSTGTGNSYVWDFGDGERSTQRNPEHLFTTETIPKEYTITLYAENQCGKDTVDKPLIVRPNTIRPLYSMDKRRICEGEEICFTNLSSDEYMNTFVDYYWDMGDGTMVGAWEACHAFTRAGVYPVTLNIDNGCGFSQRVDSVTVFPLPILNIAGEEAQCKDIPFNFSLESSERLRWVEWKMGDDSVHYSQNPFGYAYNKEGIYNISVSVLSAASTACPASVTRQVEVWPGPDVLIEPLDTMVCPPFLYVPRLTGNAYFKWDYGTGEELSAQNYHEYFNTTGKELNHAITAYVETAKGCKDEYKGFIRLHPQPVANFTKKVYYGRPEKILLINESEGYTYSRWTMPDGTYRETMGDVEYEMTGKGNLPVWLLVVNEFGCADSLVDEHHTYRSGLYFPSAFMPHSANNQVNNFKGIGMGLKEYSLEIYDLYGNKIWESQELDNGAPAEGWDGRNRKGELMPQGVYMWRAKALFFSEEIWTGKNNPSGEQESTQGTVLMLRK